MNKTIITGVIALIIGVGIGYFGGPAVHPAPSPNQRFGGFGPGPMGGRGGMMGGALNGTVAAKDASSITINTRDGSSHVVLLTPNTTVSKSVTGALSDVSTGDTILVTGTPNSDGSLSANMIQIRPATSNTPPQYPEQ